MDSAVIILAALSIKKILYTHDEILRYALNDEIDPARLSERSEESWEAPAGNIVKERRIPAKKIPETIEG